MGIEPTQPAWKAGTLPLSYTRIICNINAILNRERQDFFRFFFNNQRTQKNTCNKTIKRYKKGIIYVFVIF